MLPPQSGVPTVRRELVAGGFNGEILVGGALGIMTAELDETGGLDVDKANQWLKETHRRFVDDWRDQSGQGIWWIGSGNSS